MDNGDFLRRPNLFGHRGPGFMACFVYPLTVLRVRIVDKPKRFFSGGEHSRRCGSKPVSNTVKPETAMCPPSHDTKLRTKFRSLVVLRRGLRHSLLLSIITFRAAFPLPHRASGVITGYRDREAADSRNHRRGRLVSRADGSPGLCTSIYGGG